MTRAETLLWRYLKAGRLDGLSFRRQVPLGKFIVDFVCHAARIVIELDGESHDFVSRHRRDGLRDAWLASQGYIVLRFTNAEVLKNLAGVTEQIRATAVKGIGNRPPSLALPHKGGGNDRVPSVPRSQPNADLRASSP
jgi:very-short-patch-repair endonuclease